MVDCLLEVRASIALCEAFCIYSARLMFKPIICLGKPLAVDLLLIYNPGLPSWATKVFTLGGDPMNLTGAMFDMKIGFGKLPMTSFDLRVTACSERTGVYLALFDFTLLRGSESSDIDPSSSCTDSSLALSARLRA